MGYGDRLASGGRSATFPSAPKMTQEQWDAMWAKDEPEQVAADHLHVRTNKSVRVPQEVTHGE